MKISVNFWGVKRIVFLSKSMKVLYRTFDYSSPNYIKERNRIGLTMTRCGKNLVSIVGILFQMLVSTLYLIKKPIYIRMWKDWRNKL